MYQFRTTCLFSCLFIDLIMVLQNLQIGRLLAIVPSFLYNPKDFHTFDFRFAGALKIVSLFSDMLYCTIFNMPFFRTLTTPVVPCSQDTETRPQTQTHIRVQPLPQIEFFRSVWKRNEMS